jgi:hypothetical protein
MGWQIPFAKHATWGLDANCYIELFEDKLRITVHTYVADPSVSQGLIDRWLAGIKATWNGRFRIVADSPPGQYVAVPISADGTESPACLQAQEWRVPVEFRPLFYTDAQNAPQRGDRSPDIHEVVDPNAAGGSTHRWWKSDRHDGQTVEHCAAHEFGHFIGNQDEYGLSLETFRKVVGRDPTPDETLVDGNGSPTGYYSKLDSVMGAFMFQAAWERHVQRFVDWLNNNYVDDQCLVDAFRLERTDTATDSPTAGEGWEWYVIQQGDCLSTIAPRYGLSSWRELYDYHGGLGGGQANKHLLSSPPDPGKYPGDPTNPDLIYPGERIRVPVR